MPVPPTPFPDNWSDDLLDDLEDLEAIDDEGAPAGPTTKPAAAGLSTKAKIGIGIGIAAAVLYMVVQD